MKKNKPKVFKSLEDLKEVKDKGKGIHEEIKEQNNIFKPLTLKLMQETIDVRSSRKIIWKQQKTI